jgi:hypothetical protein
MNRVICISTLLLATSSTGAYAVPQCDKTTFDVAFTMAADELPYELSEELQRELVYQILRAHIEGRDEPTDVLLVADGIRPEWLPSVANVRWIVIGPAERHGALGDCDKFYYFDAVDDLNGRLRLGIGYGDGCSAQGQHYFFCKATGAIDPTSSGSGFGYNTSHCGKDCASGHEQPN